MQKPGEQVVTSEPAKEPGTEEACTTCGGTGKAHHETFPQHDVGREIGHDAPETHPEPKSPEAHKEHEEHESKHEEHEEHESEGEEKSEHKEHDGFPPKEKKDEGDEEAPEEKERREAAMALRARGVRKSR